MVCSYRQNFILNSDLDKNLCLDGLRILEFGLPEFLLNFVTTISNSPPSAEFCFSPTFSSKTPATFELNFCGLYVNLFSDLKYKVLTT